MDIKVPETVEAWNAAGADYLPGILGIEIVQMERDEVVAELEVTTAGKAWHGFLHAGTVVALADTACGYGTLNSLPEGAAAFTTIELKSNHIGTARSGRVSCTARPVHRGRTTQVWDAAVTAEETGKTIAHFRCTQMILWPAD